MLMQKLRPARSRDSDTRTDIQGETARAAEVVHARLSERPDLDRQRKDALIRRVEAALRDANDRHRLFNLNDHAR